MLIISLEIHIWLLVSSVCVRKFCAVVEGKGVPPEWVNEWMNEWESEWDSGIVEVDREGIWSQDILWVCLCLKKIKPFSHGKQADTQFHWKPDQAWEEKREVVGEMTEIKSIFLLTQLHKCLEC